MARLYRMLPMIVLIVLGLLFFWKLAFTDMILARGDTYAYFYPYWDARNAAFRAGELPLWTPDIFMGAPLLANPQLGTFYPPNWLTIPFRAPDAIRLSILLHIIWAALGAFTLFRQTIVKSTAPALLTASVFALSGYLGAHVEQINQLQGLAWMPWLFYFLHQAIAAQRRMLWGIVLAIGFALQIFSGHTQTVFIGGFGLGVFAIIQSYVGVQRDAPIMKIRSIGIALLTLAVASILALLLAVPQILPTLELTGMSNRGGGFTSQQATAFSLSPTYLGRALLPSYDGQLFGEYVGYIGVIALGLAILGMIAPVGAYGNTPDTHKPKHARIIWTVIAVIGLTFAMGRFNPIYWQLADLPGFNLFRVPARWLSLYALALSMLAGIGLHGLSAQKIDYKQMVIAVVPLLLLMAVGRFVLVEQVDIVGSAVPTKTTLFMWALGLVIFIVLVGAWRVIPLRTMQTLVVFLALLELFLASRVLPYNDLTPRDVYEGQRFTISQLLAYQQDEIVPGRVLSISQLYFDPGDRTRLLERYQQMGMDEQAIQTAFTAVKRQEMLFPNLSLTWGIPSIDGYEGGVLPTIYYSQFTSLMLPEGTPLSVDGRLGELMALPECRGACIPPLFMLVRTDTRYIVVDKVYDVVVDGIRFDTTFAGTTSGVFRTNNSFEADTIYILHSGDIETDFFIGSPDTDQYVVLPAQRIESVSEIDGMQLSRIVLDEPTSIMFVGTDKIIWNIDAVTIVDSRTGDFQQLTSPDFDLVLSSDVKIYRFNYGFMSLMDRRVYVQAGVTVLPDTWQGHEDALTTNMINVVHTNETDPIEVSPQFSDVGNARILSYQPTRAEIHAYSSVPDGGFLFLNDAYYPGWRATVNGEEVPIYRANVMFRAVRVPAGESTVVFEFVPMLWYYAMAFGGVVWLITTITVGILWRRGQS